MNASAAPPVNSSVPNDALAKPILVGVLLDRSGISPVPDDDEAMAIEDVCKFFGGLKPIHPATIYKWIANKGFPKPVKLGPRTSRWLKSELVAYRRTMIAGRDGAPTPPTGKRTKSP